MEYVYWVVDYQLSYVNQRVAYNLVVVECQLTYFVNRHPIEFVVSGGECGGVRRNFQKRDVGNGDDALHLVIAGVFEPFHVAYVVGAIARSVSLELNESHAADAGLLYEHALCCIVEVFILLNQIARKLHVL